MLIMAILFSLWCVLDNSVLNDYHKWNTLGYFISPLLLVGCQFFLFGKFVLLRLTFCLSFPLRALWHANLWLCSSTRRCIYRLVILSGLDDDSIIRQYGAREMEDRWMLDFDVDDPLSAMVLRGSNLVHESSGSSVTIARSMGVQGEVYSYYVEEVDEESENEFFSESEEGYETVALINGKEGRCEKKEQKDDEQQHEGGQDMQDSYKEEVKKEDRVINHIDYTQQQKIPERDYLKVLEEEERISYHGTQQTQRRPELHHQQPILGPNERVEEAEKITVQTDGGQETEITFPLPENIAAEAVPEADSGPTITNEFHMVYTREMKALDQRSQERLHVLSTMLNTRVEDQTFVFNLELRIKSLGSNICMFDSVASDKLLLRNMISDLELVYVGQSCLSWEALQHQYQSVASSVPGAVFNGSVTGKFELFSTLLERFIEKDKIDGKWVWNYIRGRSSFGNLLQVPEVTEVDGGHNEETTRAEQLLMTINIAIEIFYVFLQANNSRPLSTLEKLFKLDSQVEDPNDIGQFDCLRKEVSKKKRRLKKFAEGRRHWWKKRSIRFRDRENRVILFSKIDLELVSRVLEMFVVSTKQLQWCEETLDSIQFYEGNLIRKSSRFNFPVM